jgi:hypothetical protein
MSEFEKPEKRSILEQMAEDINKIAEAIELFPKRGLMRKLLILYLQDKTKLGKQKIELLLDGIEEFVRDYQEELGGQT